MDIDKPGEKQSQSSVMIDGMNFPSQSNNAPQTFHMYTIDLPIFRGMLVVVKFKK